jgi:hypothetical protein
VFQKTCNAQLVYCYEVDNSCNDWCRSKGATGGRVSGKRCAWRPDVYRDLDWNTCRRSGYDHALTPVWFVNIRSNVTCQCEPVYF